jgi:hypothetical protein
VIVEKREYKDGKNYSGSWVLEYDEYKYPNDLEKVTDLIKQKLNPKYLSPKYRETNKTNPFYGHCYHSTQAVYYFFKNTKFKIMSGKCDVSGHHWWLIDEDNNILDITNDQYHSIGKEPPYENGKEVKRWYGWKGQPLKRSLVLMNEVQPSSKLYKSYNWDI